MVEILKRTFTTHKTPYDICTRTDLCYGIADESLLQTNMQESYLSCVCYFKIMLISHSLQGLSNLKWTHILTLKSMKWHKDEMERYRELEISMLIIKSNASSSLIAFF